MAHDSMVVKLHKAPEESEHVTPAHIVSLKTKASERQPVREPEAMDAIDRPPVQDRGRPASVRARRVRSRVPRSVFVLGFGLLAVIVLGMLLSRQPPQSTGAASIDDLVAHVGTLILLPQGEVPTVATVSDLNALKGQAFFAHATLGDKVLMYPKAQEAVLYDPAQDKVIQVAPLTVAPSK